MSGCCDAVGLQLNRSRKPTVHADQGRRGQPENFRQPTPFARPVDLCKPALTRSVCLRRSRGRIQEVAGIIETVIRVDL